MEEPRRKRIAGAAVALVGGALASEWIVRAFDWTIGLFYENDAVDWTAARNFTGLIALVIGLYFLVRRTPKSRTERDIELVIQLGTSVASQIGAFKGAARPMILGELISLYISMQKIGIVTPKTEDVVDIEQALAHGAQFISAICPLVRDRHLREAREEAPRVIAAIGATVEPLPPKRFIRRGRYLG